jgi:diaminopimelate epimerase
VARISFEKYEGLGNDFIVVEGVVSGAWSPRTVARLCDRHFGIGADGVLLVGPPSTPGAAGAMTVLNADGSRPEMCGNGIRCVAIHLARRTGRGSGDLVIDTDGGPRRCNLDGDMVEVDMGALTDGGPVEVVLDGRAHRFARVSIGNPHAITFEPYGPAEIDSVGPRVSVAPAFPQGTNVEFAELLADGSISVVVWERGVGRTLACGTGACATAFAACVTRKRSFDELIDVRLPGGTLQVSVKRDGLTATMRGPAHLVFRGEAELPPFGGSQGAP